MGALSGNDLATPLADVIAASGAYDEDSLDKLQDIDFALKDIEGDPVLPQILAELVTLNASIVGYLSGQPSANASVAEIEEQIIEVHTRLEEVNAKLEDVKDYILATNEEIAELQTICNVMAAWDNGAGRGKVTTS